MKIRFTKPDGVRKPGDVLDVTDAEGQKLCDRQRVAIRLEPVEPKRKRGKS